MTKNLVKIAQKQTMDNKDVTLNVSGYMLKMLAAVAKISEKEALCHLYALCRIPVNKLRNPEFTNDWSSKEQKFADTPIILKVKAHCHRYRYTDPVGKIWCTFQLKNDNVEEHSAQSIEDYMIEDILLMGGKHE